MLDFIRQESNLTLTENGAVTLASTGSECLDLFASIGALRNAGKSQIIRSFVRAYSENRDAAMKLLFFGRDIREGLGERKVFRVILEWLAKNEPSSVRRNLSLIPEYGRYDDLFCLFGTPCEADMIQLVKEQFEADMAALKENRPVSLLAKWLPSVNASDRHSVRKGKMFAKAFGMNDATYRRSLSSLRSRIGIVENNIRTKDYSFDYEKIPSNAMLKYSKAFIRNDTERYINTLKGIFDGSVKIHADNLAPYELVNRYLCSDSCHFKDISESEKEILNAMWASFPDYGSEENAIAVIDTSSSMYWVNKPYPASVALSLGIYFAEHNKGVFANSFIEFSNRPRLIRLKGETFADRLRYAASFCKISDTNIEAVFELILSAAVKHHVSQKELPAKIIIISDMEFNMCARNADMTNFENARKMFSSYGYILPDIVFWNVSARNCHQPVSMDERGVVLVSGVTPRLFSMIAGNSVSPYALMTEILNKERYAKIAA